MAEASAGRKFRIACLGDSITFGHGVSESRKKDAWPFVLASLLGNDFEVKNYGVNGSCASALADFPYESSGLLVKALAFSADLYILMLGSNDTKPCNWNAYAYSEGLEDIVDTILGSMPQDEGGRERLILMLPPKAFCGADGFTAYDVDDSLIRDGVLPAIRAAAQKRGLKTIDLYSITKDHPEYFMDGVHPNVPGNRKIAEYIFPQISGLFRSWGSAF